MPDVIRDVVVRIALEQKKTRLEAPDISSVKAAILEANKQLTIGIESLAKTAMEEAKRFSAETAANVAKDIEKINAEFDKIKPPDFGPGGGGGGGGPLWDGRFGPGGGGGGGRGRGRGGSGGSYSRDASRFLSRYNRGLSELNSGGAYWNPADNNKGFNSEKFFSGAGSFARGQAAFGISGAEGSLGNAIKQSGAIIGVAETLRGAGQLAAAFGPYGIVVGAAVAGVALIDAAYSSFHEDEKKRIQEQAEHEKRLAEITKSSVEQTAAIYAAQNKRDDATSEARRRAQAARNDLLPLSERVGALGSQLVGSDAFEGRYQRAIANANRVASANGLNAAQRAQILQPDLQSITKATEAEIDKNKQLLSLKQQLAQEQVSALKAARDQVKAAEDLVTAERQRVQSFAETAGRLDAGSRKRIEQLGKKASGGGKLTDSELTELESLGGVGVRDFVSREFAARGDANLFQPFNARQVTKEDQARATSIGDEIRAQQRRLERVTARDPNSDAIPRLKGTIAGLTAEQQKILGGTAAPLTGQGSQLEKLIEAFQKQQQKAQGDVGQLDRRIDQVISQMKTDGEETRKGLLRLITEYEKVAKKLADTNHDIEIQAANNR